MLVKIETLFKNTLYTKHYQKTIKLHCLTFTYRSTASKRTLTQLVQTLLSAVYQKHLMPYTRLAHPLLKAITDMAVKAQLIEAHYQISLNPFLLVNFKTVKQIKKVSQSTSVFILLTLVCGTTCSQSLSDKLAIRNSSNINQVVLLINYNFMRMLEVSRNRRRHFTSASLVVSSLL